MRTKVKNKKIYAMVAVLAAMSLFLTGTFAWSRIVSKTNEFVGQKGGATLHDDFDPETGLKDIYVENTSSRLIFTRISLSEAMNLESSTWRPNERFTEEEKAAEGWVSDWQTHIPKISNEDCGNKNEQSKAFHDYFKWTMGGQKWYLPTTENSKVVSDTNEYKEGDIVNGVEVKQTPKAEVTTMDVYNAKTTQEKEEFTGWIFAEDGYAYWSKPLAKENITGLLLHKVTTDKSIKDTDYYYAIDVKVEAVDGRDLPMWISGEKSIDGSTDGIEASEDAKPLLQMFKETADKLEESTEAAKD